MNRNDRLRKAGIAHQLDENKIPLSQWMDITGLFTSFAFFPTSFDNYETRLQNLVSYIGLSKGIPTNLISSCYVDKDLSLEDVLVEALINNENSLYPVARYFCTEKMRSAFLPKVEERYYNTSIEAMAAISKIGIQESELPIFVRRLKHNENRIRYFAAAVLAENNLMLKTIELHDIDEVLDQDSILGFLVDFLSTGSSESFETALANIQHGHDAIGVLRFLIATIGKHATQEILDILLIHVMNCEDQNALVYFTWAIGECIHHLGFEGVEKLLIHCRDQMSSKSNELCFLINAALRYRPTNEEKNILFDILNEIQFDDRDVHMATARIREFYRDSYYPKNWLENGQYGRVVDMYAHHTKIVPDFIFDVLRGSTNINPMSVISYIHQTNVNTPFLSFVTSSLLHNHPSVLKTYEFWLYESLRNENKKAIAAALLFTPIEHSISPILLRVLVGADAGGPVEESDSTFGELVAYQREWNLREGISTYGPLDQKNYANRRWDFYKPIYNSMMMMKYTRLYTKPDCNYLQAFL